MSEVCCRRNVQLFYICYIIIFFSSSPATHLDSVHWLMWFWSSEDSTPSCFAARKKCLDSEKILYTALVLNSFVSIQLIYSNKYFNFFSKGRPVVLDDCDPNTVASLLKLYLRELPSSILTTRLAPIFDSFISEFILMLANIDAFIEPNCRNLL